MICLVIGHHYNETKWQMETGPDYVEDVEKIPPQHDFTLIDLWCVRCYKKKRQVWGELSWWLQFRILAEWKMNL